MSNRIQLPESPTYVIDVMSEGGEGELVFYATAITPDNEMGIVPIPHVGATPPIPDAPIVGFLCSDESFDIEKWIDAHKPLLDSLNVIIPPKE